MAASITIELEKLQSNATLLAQRCASSGIAVTAVTKAFCADPAIISAMENTPISHWGDSRLENIARYPQTAKKRMLLRIAEPGEAEAVVSLCDISLQSEKETILRLSEAAQKQKKQHEVVLMVDLGDLREGIYHRDYSLLLETAKLCLSAPGLSLIGLGTNLTCYGGVIPTREILQRLCDSAARLRVETGAKLPFLSGGNSSSLPLLEQGDIPAEISNLRLGEAILRGVETAYGKSISWLHQDAITLAAPIVEIQDKPSMPEGTIGMNAFGEATSFVDRGSRRRAILAIGRQDTDHLGLTCLEKGCEILGASSDHLLVDIEAAERSWKLGESLRFSLSYGSLLGCFTSPYIQKRYS